MESNRAERVAKNTGFMFIRMLVMVFIGLFTSREVLRILGASDLGIYNLVGTFVMMFSFLQNALNNATSRYITYDIGTGIKQNLQKTFSMSMNVEIILALIIIIIAEIIGPWFISNKLNIPTDRLDAANFVFQLSLLTFTINLIKTPFNSLIIANERMDFYAWTSIIEVILKLGIVYLLIFFTFDKLYLYATLYAIVTAIIFIWYLFYCKKNFNDANYIKYWDKSYFGILLRYSGLSIIVNVSDMAVIQSINIFFNIFKGVIANAALGIANHVAGTISGFLGNFSHSYYPQIVKSYASKDYDYFMKLIFSTSKLSYFLYFAFAFPVVINLDILLDLWLDKVPEQTGLFATLYIICYMFDSFSQPLMQSVHATGKIKVHQLLMSGIKLLNIPISYSLLVLGYPIYIVLVVYLFLNFICSVVRIIYLQFLIQLDLRKYFKEVIWTLIYVTLLSIPVPILIKYNSTDSFLTVLTSSFSFFIIYFLTIYRLALNFQEKEMVNNFLYKLKIIRK